MLEFIEDGHLYLLDGVLLPSVSQVLSFVFPQKYNSIPEEILTRKANFGTKIHLAVERYESERELPEMNYIEEACFNQYLRLKQKHDIEVIEQERMVHYKDVYAGRFDMIATIDGHKSLADIKTTAVLDKEYLSWQLSLYELATGWEFGKLYAIWLPKKNIGKVVEIKRIDRDVLLKKLAEYQEVNYE